MDNLQNYKQQWFDFVNYNPHPGQLQLHNPPMGEYHPKHTPDGARFIVACCGRRFGKSYSAAREAEDIVTQPNKVVCIVAPSYNTSDKIFRIVYDELVVQKGYKPSLEGDSGLFSTTLLGLSWAVSCTFSSDISFLSY